MADSRFALRRSNRIDSAQSLPLWHYLVAAILGAANTLSFAPTPHGGWIELVIFTLFFAWLTRTSGWKGAALTGWAFGFGNFVTGVWWLYVSMHDFGGMAAPLAAAAVVLFSMYIAIYPALAGVLWSFCAGRARYEENGSVIPAADEPRFVPTWHGAFAFASAWALGEWLRGLVFTGFPWLSSGYAQVDGPLASYGAIAGVYGVGWVLALVAALLVQGFYTFRHGDTPFAKFAPFIGAIVLVVAGMLLSLVEWTLPANAPLTVRLLQGNVKQEMKFEQEGVNQSLQLYKKLITEKPADLIVTPETAFPVLAVQVPQDLALALRNFSDTTNSSILFGAIGVTVSPEGRATDYTNSLFGITPNQKDVYRYDKHHLVPFGEFVPTGFHWFVALMGIPLGDLGRGPPVQKSFFVHNQPIAVDICYEDIFGEEIARTIREQEAPAGILVNSTNLAWFGDTIALDQHLQMARMRSIETGRPMLRSTNTGTTAVIAANGAVVARLPVYTTGSLDATVQGTSGRTPYVTSGNMTVILVSLLLLAFGFAFAPGRKKS
ncbi:MAG: apolipoprotein N-acyltransferase [Pseudomonadota bacterium]|jgi:apolipoprotein N-acyltransferase|uniref:Apolipoprotein N-acyltransferase n=1 Tax=Caballeronia sordidicola TaxID=196367 RepID=A0A242MYS9_CABSO|nr:apolipoprotein N-acyltransferase [Caballeronia sordidicola]MDP9154616.1 apolipoprotein N-acyltransferase [Pseudomonadota bacterium]OTP76046.1 Apolipoprotein N-acyltransferase / Copper homeostasis protein CutE [Caballeronia sordidicola]